VPSDVTHPVTGRIGKLRRRAVEARFKYFVPFLFIHINKTAGSSIERALGLPFEHKTALEKIEEIGWRRWQRKFTFCVVRNPWDRIVSHYEYRVQRNVSDLKTRPIGFAEWVRLAYVDRDPRYYNKSKMFMPQSDWITDADGRVLVDFICRFENLDDDFAEVCRRIGRDVHLPHLKQSRHGSYRDYYDDRIRAIVEHLFHEDIQRFGYRFASRSTPAIHVDPVAPPSPSAIHLPAGG